MFTDYLSVLGEPPPPPHRAESSRVGGGVGPHPVGALAESTVKGDTCPPGHPAQSRGCLRPARQGRSLAGALYH